MNTPALDPMPFLQALADERVDCVLVGGLAAAVAGTTRVTRDMDFAYATYHENLERMSRVLNRFEPRMKVLGQSSDSVVVLTPAQLRRHRTLQLVTTIGEVDILDRIAGFKSYGQIVKYSHTEDVGVLVRVLGAEGLIRSKRALKRPKDLHDIVELEALLEVASLAGSLRIKAPF